MAFARRWTGTGVFLATQMRVQFHDPLAIVSSALVETILIVFVWVLAPGYLAYALFGSLVYSLFLIGQHVLNEAAYIRIEHKLNELYHASPLTPEGYFLGMAAGICVAYLPMTIVLFVLSVLVTPFGLGGFGALLLVLLAVWLFSASLAYTISTLFKDMKAIWPYASLITNILGVVPPVFYPLALWPSEWRAIALVLPTSSGAALIDAAVGLEPLPSGDLLLAAVALGLEATATFLFAVWWARRSARES